MRKEERGGGTGGDEEYEEDGKTRSSKLRGLLSN